MDFPLKITLGALMRHEALRLARHSEPFGGMREAYTLVNVVHLVKVVKALKVVDVGNAPRVLKMVRVMVRFQSI